ncbi:MAG: UDP-N-acetylglucosamine 1-carboxyvinyltransferase [Armatimonadaceae bacterium]
MSSPLDRGVAPAEPRIVIHGKQRLAGTVPVSGSKNAALAILAGAILAESGETTLRGLPRIGDIQTMAQVLRQLGVRVTFDEDGRTARLDASQLDRCEAPAELVAQMRASFWTLGPLLARLGRARIAQPGGCNIGARPIDLHLKGLAALGAHFDNEYGNVNGSVNGGLRSAHTYLDFPSVGATMNIMMAASLTPGVTTITNAAQEPDVEDLANFLRCMGADIIGHGTGTITIRGVEKLHGCEYTVSTDRIEAGTLAAAVGVTGGDVFLEGANPDHMRPILLKLTEAGMRFDELEGGIRCIGPEGRPSATNIRAMPHPGFPTDMQQTLCSVLSLANGTSVVSDEVYENRFRFLTELAKMGAQSQVNGRTAVITGVARLTGADVVATDLRAGAALVVAGLAGEGRTRIFRTEHLDRGYERLTEKLRTLGAKIWREDEFGIPLDRDEDDVPVGDINQEVHHNGVAKKETVCSA